MIQSNLMLPTMRKQSGFSYLELLVVLTVFGLVATFSIPTFNAYNRRQNIQISAKQLKDGFRLAQNRAQTGFRHTNGGAAAWGVHLVRNANSFVLFSCPAGSGYAFSSAACSTQNETLGLTGNTRITAYVLYPSGSVGNVVNVLFEPYTGKALFLLDNGTHIQDATRTNITEIDIRVNYNAPGIIAERRTLKINAAGNIEDLRL